MTSTLEAGDQVLAVARGMRDLVAAQAADSEQLRTLSPAIVEEMWGSGLMSGASSSVRSPARLTLRACSRIRALWPTPT